VKHYNQGKHYSRHVRELTPVEFACETMQNMNRELHDLIAQYRNDSKRNINPFSMRLQGIIGKFNSVTLF
jgi:dedicator of cytokinesis protein 3